MQTPLHLSSELSRRARPLNAAPLPSTAEQTNPLTKKGSGPVIYWMSRDQRAADNWALLYAQAVATEISAPLWVVFTLVPDFLGATQRQYSFLFAGLTETEQTLKERDIPFFVLLGNPPEALGELARAAGARTIVTDYSPLRVGRGWREQLAQRLQTATEKKPKNDHVVFNHGPIPVIEVDAHNVVPVWLASPKQEFSARTFRSKFHKLLPEFLTEFPELKTQKLSSAQQKALPSFATTQDNSSHTQDTPQENFPPVYTVASAQALTVCDSSVPPVDWLTAGARAARATLDNFLANKLAGYDTARNNPTIAGQSQLSVYLHFGQLSAQRVALVARHFEKITSAVSAEQANSCAVFLEELLVRRELAENFCHYNPQYDQLAGAPNWALKTLTEHLEDPREYLYSKAELEHGQTHEKLWNAAQKQLVSSGTMHGYLRMYWAKKILEWSPNPERAVQTAIYLNDRYQLDGRDPNGYVGILWSIAGLHDRAWFRRPIYGLVRYMSESGAMRKFPVAEYIKQQESK